MIGITATGALHTPAGNSRKPLRTTDTIAARPGTGDMNFKKSTNGKIVCVENTATTGGEIETGMTGAITAGLMTIAIVMTTAIAATTAMITDACCHSRPSICYGITADASGKTTFNFVPAALDFPCGGFHSMRNAADVMV